MLFCYVADANDDNWLHETILQMLFAGMDAIDGGGAASQWPQCIPADRVDELAGRTGLRDRLASFLGFYEQLSQQEREAVRAAIPIQNAFPALFDGESDWVRLSDLPDGIRVPAKELFEYLFKLLVPTGLRDKHYKKIYAALPARVCPFCGVERLDAPGQPREDLDHYLPLSIYPFAGANLRNLSPMGGRCNTSFKHTADIIFDSESHARRRCSDPYGGPTFEISLANSVPFAGEKVGSISCPAWHIDLMGDDPEAASTWNSVFKIKERYILSHLNPEFRDWMSHFANWCALLGQPVANRDEMVAIIEQYLSMSIQEGMADSAFLKRAMFRMLRDRCADGGQSDRLVQWLSDLISIHSQPAAA